MKVKVLKLGESESGSPRKRPAPAIWRIPPWICLNAHLRHRPLLRRSLYLCFRKWESLMKISEFQFQLFQLCFRKNSIWHFIQISSVLAFDPFLFQTRRPSSSSAKEGQSSGRYRNHFDLQQFLGGNLNEFLKKHTRLRSKLISVQIFRREGFISAFTVPSYSPVGFPSSSSPSLPSMISYLKSLYIYPHHHCT